jgi:integrase
VFQGGERVKNLVTRNGTYYCRATVYGKVFLRASPYGTLDKSLRWARALIAAAKARRGDSLAETKAHSEYPTIGEFTEAYRAAAADQFALDGKPAPRTAEKNIAALLDLVKTALATERPEQLRLDVLTPELIEDRTRARVTAAAGNELDVQRARVTAASRTRLVKSLFARWTAPYYARAGIVLPPTVARIRLTGKSFRPPPYQSRPADLVARTHEEAAKLAKESPDKWAAYLLCYRFGLRAGEAAAARWSWIEVDGAGTRVLRICRRADWKGPKNLVDHSIPATADTWAALEALRGKSPHILPGPTPGLRYNLVTRDLADWMRGIGWNKATYSKGAHELRKLAGCVWLTSAGLAWAAKWLGDNPVTVAHYYASAMGSGTAVEM